MDADGVLHRTPRRSSGSSVPFFLRFLSPDSCLENICPGLCDFVLFFDLFTHGACKSSIFTTLLNPEPNKAEGMRSNRGADYTNLFSHR